MDDARFVPLATSDGSSLDEELRRSAAELVDRVISRRTLDDFGKRLRDFNLSRFEPLPVDIEQALLRVVDRVCDWELAGPGIVRCWLTLAVSARRAVRFDDAVDYCTKALVWADRSGDALLRARSRKFLGTALAELGDYVGAVRHLLDGLAIGVGTDAEVEILTNLGAVMDFAGLYREARDVYLRAEARAINTFGRHARPTIWAGLACNLATAYWKLGDFRRGLEMADKALNLVDAALADAGMESTESAYQSKAYILIETGQLDAARCCLAEAYRNHRSGSFAEGPLLAVEGLLTVCEGDVRGGLAKIEAAIAHESRTRPHTQMVELLVVAARSYALPGPVAARRHRSKDEQSAGRGEDSDAPKASYRNGSASRTARVSGRPARIPGRATDRAACESARAFRTNVRPAVSGRRASRHRQDSRASGHPCSRNRVGSRGS
jgi:tetratricopeptide (TPR) repeat protein